MEPVNSRIEYGLNLAPEMKRHLVYLYEIYSHPNPFAIDYQQAIVSKKRWSSKDDLQMLDENCVVTWCFCIRA